ncbi:hypothetical protein SAMN05216419_101166 [Nitrosomonas cryotolerans]|uniref:Uncharacterized protein n=1 Tax=Nitrosomonas cryotolerans ATCC 49181 TaxID=1131553 RepID=A0A1N6HH95_9PROT|nr:hypothetical protein SAMN05216419_101166 [Nitrosomonas cryotolerans]SIO19097.1 hypothetical protein SAMN02743940_1184 [Nitrosomonas cryotolerans ATCC 49181]
MEIAIPSKKNRTHKDLTTKNPIILLKMLSSISRDGTASSQDTPKILLHSPPLCKPDVLPSE